MLLAIDVGNTMTDFGLFPEKGDPIYFRMRSRKDASSEEGIATFKLFLESRKLNPSAVDAVIVSSVVPQLTKNMEELSRALFGISPKVLGPGLKTGLRVVTDNPKEVGADMIAASIGAKARFGHSCIIADFGTATKVMLLDETGAFAGCTIGAGVGLQESALSSSAALLPEVSLQIPSKILGKNTVDCMTSALTYGNAFAVRELANGIEKEAGYPCKRILTGGFSAAFVSLLSEFEYLPHLLLEGLVEVEMRNRK